MADAGGASGLFFSAQEGPLAAAGGPGGGDPPAPQPQTQPQLTSQQLAFAGGKKTASYESLSSISIRSSLEDVFYDASEFPIGSDTESLGY